MRCRAPPVTDASKRRFFSISRAWPHYTSAGPARRRQHGAECMGSLRRVAFTLLGLAALFTGQPAAAQPVVVQPAVHGIIERTTDHYAVAADLTYVQTS